MSFPRHPRGTTQSLRGLRPAGGFTLVEVLVATAITLILMGVLAELFAWLGTSVSDSRGIMEMLERLRAARQILQEDLRGVTCPTTPPLDPRRGFGYFEWIEGPVGPVVIPESILARPTGSTFQVEDSTIGDLDDVIMFTSRRTNVPFFGRINNGLVERPEAEVAWFIRGQRLYRRVLLISPTWQTSRNTNGYMPLTYRTGNNNPLPEGGDLSIRAVGGVGMERRLLPIDWNGTLDGANPYAMANSLGDLTDRQNRFAHQPLVWPHDARQWQLNNGRPGLGLPLREECNDLQWPLPVPMQGSTTAGAMGTALRSNTRLTVAVPGDPLEVYIMPNGGTTNAAGVPGWTSGVYQSNNYVFDPWGGAFAFRANFDPYRVVNQIDSGGQTAGLQMARLSSYVGSRDTPDEDAILSHVLEFDVKGWDPGAPLFQASEPNTPTGAAPRSVVLMPGDPGWVMPQNRGALNRFMNTGYNAASDANLRLAGFGAYVDLNYMYHGGRIGAALPHMTNNDTAAGGKRTYEDQLGRFETSMFNPMARGRIFPRPWFAGPGEFKSGLQGAVPTGTSTPLFPPAGLLACVWDTYSTSYESDGRDQNAGRVSFTPYSLNATGALPAYVGLVDEGANGTDDNNNGAIDDEGEQETSPPYPRPLRGIQIRIRCFEPDSRQIRSVTLVHEFLPE